MPSDRVHKQILLSYNSEIEPIKNSLYDNMDAIFFKKKSQQNNGKNYGPNL